MKRLVFILITIIVAFIVYVNVNADIDEIVIPDAAIRVRVIADSNSVFDQSMKMKVRAMIEEKISAKLVGIDNIEEAREVIGNEIEQLESDIEVLFVNNDYNKDFVVNFGVNFFPEKDYRGIHYDEGEYESLVVTIGEGNGDNWWCVLFPPLCLLEASDSEVNDADYKFFVLELINKIFS